MRFLAFLGAIALVNYGVSVSGAISAERLLNEYQKSYKQLTDDNFAAKIQDDEYSNYYGYDSDDFGEYEYAQYESDEDYDSQYDAYTTYDGYDFEEYFDEYFDEMSDDYFDELAEIYENNYILHDYIDDFAGLNFADFLDEYGPGFAQMDIDEPSQQTSFAATADDYDEYSEYMSDYYYEDMSDMAEMEELEEWPKWAKKIAKKLKKAGRNIGKKIKKSAAKIKNKIKKAGKAIKKFGLKIRKKGKEIGAKIKKGAKKLHKKIKRGAFKLGRKIRKKAKHIHGKMKRGAKHIRGKIKRVARKIRDRAMRIQEKARKALMRFGRRIRERAKRLQQKAKKLGSKIKKGAIRIGHKIKKGSKKLFKKAKTHLRRFGGKIKGGLRKIGRKVKGGLKKFGNFVRKWGKKALHSLVTPPIVHEVLNGYVMYLRIVGKRQGGAWKKLPKTLIKAAQPFYQTDLSSVRYTTNVNTIHGQAIAFGNKIYFPKDIDIRHSQHDLWGMLHELEHCDQYRQNGGIWPFLSKYMASFKMATKIVQKRSFNMHDHSALENVADRKACKVVRRVWKKFGEGKRFRENGVCKTIRMRRSGW